MKNKRKKQLFITIAIILILIAVFCLIHFLNRTKMNSGYVNGNSAGNLYNGGLFCESNGTVFFSNPSDNHRLYSMNPDGSDMKKLSDDTVSYINADDHYVYYVRNNKSEDTNFSFLNFGTNSLCRINRDGGRVTILDDDPSLYAGLYGNYIYYIHYDKETASTLYRIKIDGTKKEQFMNKNIRQKFIISAALMIAATASAFAQGNGIAGITEATSMVTSYFDPGTKLIYAIGAVVGLIGGVKVYGKFSSGDPDTSKTAASWFGACIFLIVAATILRSFFL